MNDRAAHRTACRKERIRSVLNQRQSDLALVMNNIHDSHNVSAILRSCDAFGVHFVHLLYTHENFPYLGKKSSASAKKWVDISRHTSASGLVADIKSRGKQILCTGFAEGSASLTDIDFTLPTAVVLGNEHRGIDRDMEKASDKEVYIPMQGMVQSFNVSVAAAVILYEAWRQRKEAGLLRERCLSSVQREKFFQKWIRK